MKLFKILVVPALLILIQSCMLSGKMTKIVSEHYAQKSKLRMAETPAWLAVKTDSLPRINGYCQANYKRFFTVPLIVYVYSDEKIECRINPRIYANLLADELMKAENASVAKNRLGEKQLEIWVSQVPTTFYHRYYSHYVALQLLVQNLYFSVNQNELSNMAGTIRISFRVKDGGATIKSGTLTSGIAGSFYIKNYSQRRLYFVQDFVSSFDNQLETAIKQLSTELINQIQL